MYLGRAGRIQDTWQNRTVMMNSPLQGAVNVTAVRGTSGRETGDLSAQENLHVNFLKQLTGLQV